jgi:hypothetical protein
VCAPYYVEHVISVAGNIEYIDGTLLHIRKRISHWLYVRVKVKTTVVRESRVRAVLRRARD